MKERVLSPEITRAHEGGDIHLVEQASFEPVSFEPVTITETSQLSINRFYESMHKALGTVLHGEKHAKDAAILSLVLRKPLLLSGYPGGGKSTLSEMMPATVNVPEDRIALLSGQYDITGNQVLGGVIESNKEMVNPVTKEVTSEQVMRTVINGIIKARTMCLRLEEMNGLNPNALRSLLSVLENKRIENASGEVTLDDIISVIGTMNPTESGESTFEISDAMASRFSIGAVMGITGNDEERLEKQLKRRELKAERTKENGEMIRAKDFVPTVVTDPKDLRKVYTTVKRTEIDLPTYKRIAWTAIRVANTFKEMRTLIEDDNRITDHVEELSQGLGVLRNADRKITDEDIHDATRMVVAARVGAKQNAQSIDLDSTVKDITRF